MKINIQKIAYRAIPVLTAFVVIVSCVAAPVMAATVNGKTVIDYNDYVSNVEVDGDNDIVTVSLPPYLYGYQSDDSNGKNFTQGVPLGSLVSNNRKAVTAALYFPGAGVTNTYLDITNIPDGSIFSTTGKVWLETNTLGSGFFEGTFYTNIHYYDSNFNLISTETSTIYSMGDTNGAYVYELKWNFVMEKPDNAVYCITSFRFRINGFYQGASADNVFWFDFDFPKLKMSISSMYRLQEQTGKTNELLQNLIDGTPEQGEAVGGAVDDMHNAAGELENMGDQLAGVEKPNMDNVNVSWDAAVPYAAMMAFVAPLNALWENPTLLGMLTIVLTLVLISWVFFGKKV